MLKFRLILQDDLFFWNEFTQIPNFISHLIFEILKNSFQLSAFPEQFFWNWNKKWEGSKDKNFCMNDVSNCEATSWCQNFCQFDWLNILYFQATFGKERVRANKFIVKFTDFDDRFGGCLALAWWYKNHLDEYQKKKRGNKSKENDTSFNKLKSFLLKAPLRTHCFVCQPAKCFS